jgi:hypothetical protein
MTSQGWLEGWLLVLQLLLLTNAKGHIFTILLTLPKDPLQHTYSPLLPPTPDNESFFFTIPIGLPFLECHFIGVIHTVWAFSDWLLSVSSVCVCVCVCVWVSPMPFLGLLAQFLALNNIPLSGYITFIYPFVHWRMSWLLAHFGNEESNYLILVSQVPICKIWPWAKSLFMIFVPQKYHPWRNLTTRNKKVRMGDIFKSYVNGWQRGGDA